MTDQQQYDLIASLANIEEPLKVLKSILNYNEPISFEFAEQALELIANRPDIIDRCKIGFDLNDCAMDGYQKAIKDLQAAKKQIGEVERKIREFFNKVMREGGADRIMGEHHKVTLVRKPEFSVHLPPTREIFLDHPNLVDSKTVWKEPAPTPELLAVLRAAGIEDQLVKTEYLWFKEAAEAYVENNPQAFPGRFEVEFTTHARFEVLKDVKPKAKAKRLGAKRRRTDKAELEHSTDDVQGAKGADCSSVAQAFDRGQDAPDIFNGVT